MKKTFDIFAKNINDFNNEVKKLNNKLIKNNVSIVEVTYGESHYDESYDEMRIECEVNFPDITALVNDGKEWFFVGTVEKIDGNISRNPFEVDAELLRDSEIICECCGKAISRRTKSLVFSNIKNPTNKTDLKFFGTSCAKKYFPINIESILGFYETFINSYDDECEDGCGDYEDDRPRGGRSNTTMLDLLIQATLNATNDCTQYKNADYGADSTRANVEDWITRIMKEGH